MSLKDTIDLDMKTAMKSGDKNRLTTIRAIRAGLLEKEVSIRVGGKAELSDEQQTEVLVGMAKRRRDSITQFTEGNRPDLAAIEEAELAIIEEFLPEPATDEEITAVVKEIITATGAASMKDMGKVMGQAMKSLKGKADGTIVQNTVKSLLNP
ncbi:MAG: GatB/YqeY domain-containing protein [Candidatus Chlorobium antarcticum]|jgi:uncharacterized protein YqeY|nr:GatB/YqeY domain-containing protein [Candidatus Chlorobium antarcticum]